MTINIEPERLQKFWEKCGFTIVTNYDDPTIIEESRSPIGERVYPELTLDNLFKYAVPKVQDLDGIEFWQSIKGWVC